MITITFPSPILVDMTPQLKTWHDGILESTLPSLARICDDILLPTIMCPWGESVFLHKCGSIPLDTTFQRYIQYCEIKLINPEKLDKVKYARDDYI